MASLTLKHVDRAFPNGYEAVKDLNFQIEDGEFVILTGPSGSGKSAVMRMIAGLDEVKNGEIWIGDKLVNSLPPEERGIAMIFQNYTVYPRMTQELVELQEKTGVTILYATKNVEEMALLGKRKVMV